MNNQHIYKSKNYTYVSGNAIWLSLCLPDTTINVNKRMYVRRLRKHNINGRDVKEKNVVNNEDMSSFWAP